MKDEVISSLETLFQGVSHLISITEKLEKEIAELKSASPAIAPEWMDMEKLMEYLPTHPCRRVVYVWVRDKKIPCHRLQGSLIFNRAEIDEWIVKGSPEFHPESTEPRD